ncbi:MAG: hypothetical protein KDB01_17100 [Planctomycetaceae bacterium]|nr:hypothetical protein [Planctomycetaceae bacterium]
MTVDKPPESSDFEHIGQEPEPGLLREIWTFIKEERIWWMGPIVIALILVGALVALTSTGAAPFIYTLF